ncbi:hypothetical protein [Lysobacter enzymogenes]|uniref:hypothetical protein n=1 Tax=Lysobacter enzymogenes TaxID=69 RepID=UPI000F4B17FD|nr:hypothetical protein [Lysobacter enzymogenes]
MDSVICASVMRAATARECGDSSQLAAGFGKSARPSGTAAAAPKPAANELGLGNGRQAADTRGMAESSGERGRGCRSIRSGAARGCSAAAAARAA